MRKRDEKRESKTDHTVDKANIIDGDKEGPVRGMEFREQCLKDQKLHQRQNVCHKAFKSR